MNNLGQFWITLSLQNIFFSLLVSQFNPFFHYILYLKYLQLLPTLYWWGKIVVCFPNRRWGISTTNQRNLIGRIGCAIIPLFMTTITFCYGNAKDILYLPTFLFPYITAPFSHCASCKYLPFFVTHFTS
jgi:hypothetical protein